MGASALIVEFLGLPGSGKSTIVRAVVAGSEPGFALSGKEERKWHSDRGVMRRRLPKSLSEWRVLFQAMAFAHKIRPFRSVRFRRALSLSTAYRRTLAGVDSGQCEAMLMDQWLLQGVWSIAAFGHYVGGLSLEQLVKTICAQHERLIVFVELDVPTAVERLGDRPTAESRFDRMSDTEAEHWLGNSVTIMENIVAAARRAGVRTVTLNGLDAIHDNADRVIAAVKECRRLQRHPLLRGATPAVGERVDGPHR